MKIKFTEAPKGRDYKAGDVVEFNGAVEEGYARKYIVRGWAQPVDEHAVKAAAKDKADAEAAAKAEADARKPVKQAHPSHK